MQQQTQSTEVALLPPADRAVIVMGSAKAEAQLRDLIGQSAGIVSVIDMAGRDEAHRAAMNLKNARIAIEKTGKAAREDAQAFSKAVIAEEARLKAIVAPEEDRVFGLRDGFDSKLAREKAERERIEKERVDGIKAKIAIFRSVAGASLHDDAETLRATLSDLMACEPLTTTYAEFTSEAIEAVAEARTALQTLLTAAEEREAEAARQVALAEENRRAAAELAEQQRVAAETKRQLEAQAAKIAADRRAEEQRIAGERATFEAEKAAFAKQQAEAAEAARVAALPVETVVAHLDGGDDKHLRVLVDRAELPGVEVAEPLPGGQYYSTTTFRDDGKPILCNADGTRSVFCDLDDWCPLEFSYSGVDDDVLTIEGIKYAGSVFRKLGGLLPVHTMFELRAREDGVLTIYELQQVAA